MKKENLLLLVLLCSTLGSFAQRGTVTGKPITHKTPSLKRTLYQFGHADAFVNGLYQGILPWRELRRHGDFGLGAPDQVDGELTMHQGTLYQTTADGRTRRVDDRLKIPFAFVTTFNPDKVINLEWSGNLQALCEKLKGLLSNHNGMYAIRLSGNFRAISTRAFPPFTNGDNRPLGQVLGTQRIFRFNNLYGRLIGFYLPGYLAGINIAGFHFHFLSQDLTKGGHVLELEHKGVLHIEIAELDNILLEMPKTGSFLDFPFTKENKGDLEKVEKGSR